jgi:hypothetical protein
VKCFLLTKLYQSPKYEREARSHSDRSRHSGKLPASSKDFSSDLELPTQDPIGLEGQFENCHFLPLLVARGESQKDAPDQELKFTDNAHHCPPIRIKEELLL